MIISVYRPNLSLSWTVGAKILVRYPHGRVDRPRTVVFFYSLDRVKLELGNREDFNNLLSVN